LDNQSFYQLNVFLEGNHIWAISIKFTEICILRKLMLILVLCT
jgi:hypothetical protein